MPGLPTVKKAQPLDLARLLMDLRPYIKTKEQTGRYIALVNEFTQKGELLDSEFLASLADHLSNNTSESADWFEVATQRWPNTANIATGEKVTVVEKEKEPDQSPDPKSKSRRR
jgi:hypothetical protein